MRSKRIVSDAGLLLLQGAVPDPLGIEGLIGHSDLLGGERDRHALTGEPLDLTKLGDDLLHAVLLYRDDKPPSVLSELQTTTDEMDRFEGGRTKPNESEPRPVRRSALDQVSVLVPSLVGPAFGRELSETRPRPPSLVARVEHHAKPIVLRRSSSPAVRAELSEDSEGVAGRSRDALRELGREPVEHLDVRSARGHVEDMHAATARRCLKSVLDVKLPVRAAIPSDGLGDGNRV